MTTLNCRKCNIIQEDHGQKFCLDCGGGPLEFYEHTKPEEQEDEEAVQHLTLMSRPVRPAQERS